MYAIQVHRFGGPEVLSFDALPDPEPSASQVRVRVHAVGVNPADTYVRAGSYARLPSLPYIPGWDGAGIVDAVGSDVRGIAPGDRVYFHGTAAGRGLGAYSQLVLCDPSQVHSLPAHLSFAQGAAIGVPYATAWRALMQKGHAEPGETVLIHGASGGVGIAAVQIARAQGLVVIATAGSDTGRAVVEQQGAHHALLHGMEDVPDRVRALTEGRGVDLIVEMLANVNLDRDITMLSANGRVLIVGNRGRIEIDPRQVMMREASITGVFLWNATEDEMREAFGGLAEGFASEALCPVVGEEFPLRDAAAAHVAVLEHRHRGKVVLVN